MTSDVPNPKSTILHRLRQQQRAVAHPPAWHSRREFADLAAQFAAALTAVHGEVHLADSLAAAADTLGALLAELDARQVVANAEPPLTQLHLPDRWPHITWRLVPPPSTADDDPTADDTLSAYPLQSAAQPSAYPLQSAALRAFCAAADAGISSAAAALAETGSVLIHSGPGQSRLATLLPPVHIVLLPASALTADLFTFTASRDGEMPANMTFVSGPSKTADIEQTMAIGVHGPKRFVVILYQD